MNPADIVARALSAQGRPTRYKLGAGGRRPHAQHPADIISERVDAAGSTTMTDYPGCDCSGFVAWCLGVPRWVKASHPWHGTFAGEWIETTQLVRNAREGRVFKLVEAAEPGDLIVYGDSPKGQGHVGIITPGGVTHCSMGNWKQHGDAIRETPVAPFWAARGAIYARLAA